MTDEVALDVGDALAACEACGELVRRSELHYLSKRIMASTGLERVCPECWKSLNGGAKDFLEGVGRLPRPETGTHGPR